MDRRNFLKWISKGALYVAAAPLITNLDEIREMMQPKSLIFDMGAHGKPEEFFSYTMNIDLKSLYPSHFTFSWKAGSKTPDGGEIITSAGHKWVYEPKSVKEVKAILDEEISARLARKS